MSVNNFHQEDPRRRGSGDGNDGPNPSTGNGDMLKSVYDGNDDGRVNSADHATSATTAVDLSGAATAGFLKYYGTNDVGDVGFFDLPAGGGGGSSTFLGLSDTPASYLTAAGYKVKVNSATDALEFVTDTFLTISDTPSSYSGQAGKLLAVNGTEDGVEFVAGGGGASNFTDLGDTPANYTGQAGKVPTVNVGEDALEFTDLPAEGQSLTTKTTANTGTLPSWAAWIADTSGGALSRAMPTSPADGEEVTVHDVNGNAATNNITLTVTGPTTITQPVLNLDNQSKKWRYDSTGDVWDLVFSDTPSTGGGGGSTTSVQIVVPAANVDSDLTDFPLVITGEFIPQDIYDAASTDITVLDSGSSELPTELAYFDTTNKRLRVHVLVDLSSTVDNEFTLSWDTTRSAATDPFVTAGYEAVVPMLGDFQTSDYTSVPVFGNSSAVTPTKNGSSTAPIFQDYYITNQENSTLGVALTNSLSSEIYLICMIQKVTISSAAIMGLEATGTGSENLSFSGTVVQYNSAAGTNRAEGATTQYAPIVCGFYRSTSECELYIDATISDFLSESVTLPALNEFTVMGRDSNISGGIRANHYEYRVGTFRPTQDWLSFETKNMDPLRGNRGYTVKLV